jgi:ferredoxin
MTYVITANCTQDGECVDACPVDCIHPNRSEPGFGEGAMLYVNPDECIDCGACEPVCPAEAIFTEDNLPEEWQSFTEINRLYYQDAAAAEAAVLAHRNSH